MSTAPSYRYSHTVGFFGGGEGGRGFNDPVDVALGRDGVLYVVNRGDTDTAARLLAKHVTVCTVDEEYIGKFGTGGSGDGHLMWPAAIALDRDENVYISDEALQRVSIFDKSGRFLAKWGRKGTGPGEFDRPAGIAFDPEGNLVVVDGLNSRVQRYTPEGGYLGGWGRPGTGDGELNMPWGVAVAAGGEVYVADWRNDRIQKFDVDGGHLATLGSSGVGEGQFRRPAGVAVDEDGYVYVADWGNERVQVLGPDGGSVARFRGESGLNRWARDYFVANQDELEERGKADMEPEPDTDPSSPEYFREQSASIEKLFWGPTSVKLDGAGRMFVVESARYRIQVYQRQPDDGSG